AEVDLPRSLHSASGSVFQGERRPDAANRPAVLLAVRPLITALLLLAGYLTIGLYAGLSRARRRRIGLGAFLLCGPTAGWGGKPGRGAPAAPLFQVGPHQPRPLRLVRAGVVADDVDDLVAPERPPQVVQVGAEQRGSSVPGQEPP